MWNWLKSSKCAPGLLNYANASHIAIRGKLYSGSGGTKFEPRVALFGGQGLKQPLQTTGRTLYNVVPRGVLGEPDYCKMEKPLRLPMIKYTVSYLGVHSRPLPSNILYLYTYAYIFNINYARWENFLESYESKPKSDYVYYFTIELDPNRRLFKSESTGKW